MNNYSSGDIHGPLRYTGPFTIFTSTNSPYGNAGSVRGSLPVQIRGAETAGSKLIFHSLRQVRTEAIIEMTPALVFELPYDDDPEWNESFSNSLDALQRLADKAQKDDEEGRTVDLDPDNL